MYGLPDFNMLFQLVLTKFFKSELFSCLLDCERSLFSLKFSEGSAHADERWAAKPRDARNEGGSPRRKKKNRETARSLTLRSRFTCLACQPFSFHAKKSLDRERPFSLALRVVYLFSCLSRLAPSVTRVVICVSRAFCSTDQEKRETARSLRVYRKLITWPTKAKDPFWVQEFFSADTTSRAGTAEGCTKRNILKERYCTNYQALILGMIDFVHLLNDRTLLVHFKS